MIACELSADATKIMEDKRGKTYSNGAIPLIRSRMKHHKGKSPQNEVMTLGDLLCLMLPLAATLVAVGVAVFLRPDMLAVSTSLSHVADTEQSLNGSRAAGQNKTAQLDKELKPVAWIDGEMKTLATALRSAFHVLQLIGYHVVTGSHVTAYDVLYTRYNMFQEQTVKVWEPHRMANHFPGIYELTYKPTIVALHRNLSAVPKGFLLPDEEAELREQVTLNPDRLYVQKNTQHRGVVLVNGSGIDFSRNSVVQEFIEDAHLFKGYRYDIGVYVLLTSLSPIRAYTLDEWRIKFCRLPFNQSNLNETDSYVVQGLVDKIDGYPPVIRALYEDPDIRRKPWYLNLLRKQGMDPEVVLQNIQDTIRKVLLLQVPLIASVAAQKEVNKDNLYESMRFDFIISEDLQANLMEVNMSPNMVWDDRRPNMKRTVVQILHSVFSASGIGTNYDKPRSLWSPKEWDLEVTDQDIITKIPKCSSRYCAQLCTDVICSLCATCLDKESTRQLKQAFVEHTNRKKFARILPAPFKTQSRARSWDPLNDPEFHKLPTKDQQMALWFWKKCLQDVTFCN